MHFSSSFFPKHPKTLARLLYGLGFVSLSSIAVEGLVLACRHGVWTFDLIQITFPLRTCFFSDLLRPTNYYMYMFVRKCELELWF